MLELRRLATASPSLARRLTSVCRQLSPPLSQRSMAPTASQVDRTCRPMRTAHVGAFEGGSSAAEGADVPSSASCTWCSSLRATASLTKTSSASVSFSAAVKSASPSASTFATVAEIESRWGVGAAAAGARCSGCSRSSMRAFTTSGCAARLRAPSRPPRSTSTRSAMATAIDGSIVLVRTAGADKAQRIARQTPAPLNSLA